MAEILATPTVAQVEGITRTQLFKRVLNESGLGDVGTCSAAGGAGGDTFVDTTQLKSTQYDSRDHVGGWARISNRSGHTAPEGEIAPITTYAPSSGTITVNPVFSAQVPSGASYELWHNPNPQRVKDFVDTLLTEQLFFPCWTMLTECPDGDMEQSGTGDWTASNVTLAKLTALPGMFGKRYLGVTTTTAGGYARSALFRGEPTKSYHASAVVRASATGTTARLEVWDETNNASIGYIQSANLYPSRLYLDFPLPATCYSFSVRLTNVENLVTTHWDEVCVYSKEARTARLPWWFKNRDQKIGIFKLNPRNTGPATPVGNVSGGMWDADFNGELDRQWTIQDRFYGGGQLFLESHFEPITYPLYAVALRNETAYSDDNTDIKLVDATMLTEATKFKIYEHLVKRGSAGQMNLENLRKARDEAFTAWKQQEYFMQENLNKLLTAPSTSILVTDRWSKFGYRY